MFRHPAARDLEALLDAESGYWRALRLRLHLRSCLRCSERLAQLEMDGEATAALLDTLEYEPRTDEAWARFVARSNGRVGTHDRSVRLTWYGTGFTTGLAAAGIALLVGLYHRDPARLREMETPLRDPAAAKAAGPADYRFIRRLQDQLKRGEVRLLHNRCCSDRDGEGPADDGMLIVATGGQSTSIVVMYEDVDRSGTLSPGDIVRLVSRGPPAADAAWEDQDRS